MDHSVMRSLLFVPADSSRKLDKAMASGADAIIVDLEDSIAAEGKAEARKSAAAFLQEAVKLPTRPRLLVRVNGFATGLIDADLDAVVPARPDAIMLPKAEGGGAVFHAGTYRGASARLQGLTWGAEDLSLELGAEVNRDAVGRFFAPYQLARALCLAGAAAAQGQGVATLS